MNRIWHPWTKWECFKAGFFTPMKGKAAVTEAQANYRRLLTDIHYFERVLARVITEWKYSCEHNLTNESMNRIAWLGQASCALEFGCCAEQTRSAFQTLTEAQQNAANAAADKYLQFWLSRHEASLNEQSQAVQS